MAVIDGFLALLVDTQEWLENALARLLDGQAGSLARSP
jgi:hypothetical protein